MRRTLSPRSESRAFVQYTRSQFPAQRIRNSNRYVVGAGYRTLLPVSKDPEISVRAFLGIEKPKASGRQDLGYTVIGASVAANVTLSAQYSAFLTLAGEDRNYRGTGPIFGVDRSDLQLQASAGLTYRPARFWEVVPMASYVRNISNRNINDFAFGLFQVSVFRTFN